ncbi:acyltransferase family protein [Microbacterium phyllosphaerae]|uniref:acyltransferase family protein n=1 Tax=Microbacterium phyllosphaerae TaxID=124798 RepID=UPI00216AA887|nr:acyltransferase family protein [Microbacterium phyllosphaerae]MCS3443274.1 peptidoglycan/LPS O-acetylase OafA/YrhL [Microbacterium phyllosphaerae]
MADSLSPTVETLTSGAPSAVPLTRAALRARSGSRVFRTDIQALRAVAVLLVVIYHLRPNRITGGFIGVDVFFVISGYLITSHLIREAARSGTVKLGAFWAARARRILPASLVAIAVTILLTAWIAPVTLLADLQRQALASIFYVQNWVLALDAVDYSAADNEATAFQHFWSLSVEEQFYLFWPLLVLLALWIVTRRASVSTGDPDPVARERRLRRVLASLFGAVVLASLVFSIVAVAEGQANAYFVTTTRVWELGAGGLLALVSIRHLAVPWRALIAYVGIALVGVSAFTLTNETPFPGLAAIPVIVGTAAIILAGTPSTGGAGTRGARETLPRFDPWTWVSRLSVVQWIGDRSYSLYLWHFPVIVLWMMVADRKPDYLDIIAMSVISVVAGHLSYRYIEQPTRQAAFFRSSTRRSLSAAGIAMILAAALTFVYPWSTAQAVAAGDWDALASESRSLPEVGAQAVSEDSVPTFTTSDAAVTPNPLQADEDRNIAFSGDECVAEVHDPVTPSCAVGDPDADVSIALVGDSHARMYSTALAEMAEDHGWLLTTHLRNSCPFSPVPRDMEVANELDCTEPNAEVMDEILADAPDLVVTTWTFAATFTDEDATGVPGADGFAQYWNTLEDAGIEVLVLRDTPRMDENIPDCVAENYDNPDACARDRDDALPGAELFAEAVAAAPAVQVADFTDLFCDEEICKPVIGNVIAYTDSHHLTDSFAMSMIPMLTTEIEAALPAS